MTTTSASHRLGGLLTSPLGLGCMGLSQGYGPADDAVSVQAVHAALESGMRLLDTAMSYGEGGNERLLARALAQAGAAGRTAQVATKVGITRGTDGVRLDAAPERIRGYCEASLARMDRDVIDLYYLHRVDPAYPLEEQVGALAELVAAGLVRHIGVSEVTGEQLRRACAAAPVAAVQVEWSLAWRAPEQDVVPVARELGVGIAAYSPLGRGLLTGDPASADPASSSFRGQDPRFAPAALAANTRRTAELAALARELGATAGQLALAWLLSRGDDVVPLPGSRRPERVRENAAAADLTLTADVLARLDALAGGFVGNRHSFAVPRTER